MQRPHNQPQMDCGDFVKVFIGREFLETTCSELIVHMHEAGYFPDILGNVWRGGAHSGAYGTGNLQRLGVDHVHYPVTGKSYSDGAFNQSHTVEISNMEELTRYMRAFGKERLCFFDDVIDTGVTAHALITAVQNGLRRQDAQSAHIVKNRQKIDIHPDRARFLGPEYYAVYEFPMTTDGVSYTVKAHMVCDILPVDADVAIVAPFEKRYANLTRVMPRFCEYDFGKVDGKPVWLNFPYELSKSDITDHELADFRPNVAAVHSGLSKAV